MQFLKRTDYTLNQLSTKQAWVSMQKKTYGAQNLRLSTPATTLRFINLMIRYYERMYWNNHIAEQMY